MGRISVLVNCAGVVSGGKTVGREGPHDLGQFRRTIDINLTGTFNCLRLVAAEMARNASTEGERGVIVNTASIAAFDGQKGQAAYAASKAGIAGMTLPIARDLAGNGIRICAIAPGVFLTPMLEGLGPELQESLAADVTFPRRLGRPEEFAALAGFIVECGYLNGEVIRLDGALRMS
jgi:NAD(P)-dependent dehydrogenase (short-subunit alcohol dehydrogenase family)